MRGLNLDQLRAFMDVVERGSFSAAAARLNLTQPAVSLQVKLLEQRLGVRLIERVGRRASATAAGETLLHHARRIETEVAAALEGMADHATGMLGRIRLGTGATACIHLLPPLLRELRRRFPSLEIAVATGTTGEILKALEENSLDVGFVTFPVTGRMFEVTPILEDEYVAVAPADVLSPPDVVTPDWLANQPVVLEPVASNTRRALDEWFLASGIHPKPVMELASVEAIKELVGAGLGWSVMPRMAAPAPDRAAFLTRPLAPRLYRTLGLVVRRDKPRSRGLREMIAALETLKIKP